MKSTLIDFKTHFEYEDHYFDFDSKKVKIGDPSIFIYFFRVNLKTETIQISMYYDPSEHDYFIYAPEVVKAYKKHITLKKLQDSIVKELKGN